MTRSVPYLLLAFLASTILCVHGQGCHPQCSWACDDPTCDSICQPVCEPPVCSNNCTVGDPAGCTPPRCEVSCPNNMCEADSCPTCETVCYPPNCASGHECTILCEPTNCGWYCGPGNCAAPQCVLQCEQPACAVPAPKAAQAPRDTSSLLMLVAVATSVLQITINR